jgi:hypothetical protein
MHRRIGDVRRGIVDIQQGIVDVQWGIVDVERGIFVVDQDPFRSAEGSDKMLQPSILEQGNDFFDRQPWIRGRPRAGCISGGGPGRRL